MFKTNRATFLSIVLGLTGVVWVEASTCYDKWVQDRTKCTDNYYKTIREPSENKRLRDLDIDQEEFDLNDQCETQFGSDQQICDKTRLMEESMANDKFYASFDKAGAAFAIAMGYCFWVNATPAPGPAQAAAATCLLAAGSVYATAIAALRVDYYFDMRAAEKKHANCSFIADEKKKLCKAKVKADIGRKRKFEQNTLDKIVERAFEVEQNCLYEAEERYKRCGSSRP